MLKKIRYIRTAVFLGWALCLAACQNEELDRKTGSLRISAFAYEGQVVSRGYSEFTNVYGASAANPLVMPLWAQLEGVVLQSSASYNGGEWSTSCRLEPGTYDFYSYLPQSITNDGVTVNLTPSTSTTPATVTFKNVVAVQDKDILLSVATPSGNETTTNNPFDQVITGEENQIVTFRMDHILAKLSLSFSNPAGKSFSDMRKIVVRRVQIVPPTSGSKHDVACTMGQTITYNWAPQTPGPTDFFINDDTEFTINGKKAYGYLVEQNASKAYCSCYMVPFNNNKIKIRVIYDVYTHDGSLIRDNEISVNNNLTISNTSTVAAGMEYKINVKIIPDYLYMLSDVDAGTSLEIKTN